MKAEGVGIADVIRAIEALRPNRTAAEVVVAMCGFSLMPAQAAAPSAEPAGDDLAGADPDLESVVTSGAATEPLPPSVQRLQPVRQGSLPPPTVDPFAGLAPAAAGAPRAFEGLLTARDCAELLRLAASVPMLTDSIDLDRVTNELAHARPIMELPRYISIITRTWRIISRPRCGCSTRS